MCLCITLFLVTYFSREYCLFRNYRYYNSLRYKILCCETKFDIEKLQMELTSFKGIAAQFDFLV